MAWITLTDFAARGADPIYAIEDADEAQHNAEALAAAGTVVPLGGSASEGVRSATWIRTPGYLPARLNATVTEGLTRQAVVVTRTNDAGTSVQWQIVDDEDTVLVEGTEHSEVEEQEEIVAITPAEDGHRYYLELQGSNADALVFARGVLELFSEEGES